MKFDYVVGNPPYQDSSHSEKKNTLWRKFIDLSLKICKERTGIVSFVVPSSWMGSKKILDKYFLNKNILYINKDECKKHFPLVGSTFSYYVLENCPYAGTTIIKNKEINNKIVENTVNLDDIILDCFPRNMSKESVSVIKKVLDTSRPKLGIVNNTTHHSVHKERWRLTGDNIFKYPIQNTPSKLYWWNSPHKDSNKLKLLIPTTTYFRNMLLTTNGVTQSFCYYLIKEDEDPDIVLHNINNIVFDYVNECFRYANWNSVQLLRKLPQIPFDKKMTDQEIFNFFNLNDAEIEEVRNSIKWK